MVYCIILYMQHILGPALQEHLPPPFLQNFKYYTQIRFLDSSLQHFINYCEELHNKECNFYWNHLEHYGLLLGFSTYLFLYKYLFLSSVKKNNKYIRYCAARIEYAAAQLFIYTQVPISLSSHGKNKYTLPEKRMNLWCQKN